MATSRTYLAVPHSDKAQARTRAGRLDDGRSALRFDKGRALWYALPGADMAALSPWKPDPLAVGVSAGDAPTQFADFLRAQGADLPGPAVMDGMRQRIRMTDDKPGKKSCTYVGHLDGLPNGWFNDFRDGGTANPTRWVFRGETADPQAALHLKAITAQRQWDRMATKRQQQDNKAGNVAHVYRRFPQAAQHPYLAKKGVPAMHGVHIDDRQRLLIPLQNCDGQIRSMQTIDGDGNKRLTRDAEKNGNFFVVGGVLTPGQPLVLAEGYATAASGAMALGMPVVMAIDASNMVTVAQRLHERYPSSTLLLLGDDDPPTARRPGNPGREAAEKGAQLTGGLAVFPAFTAAERARGATDFNDLHQSRGLAALTAQLTPYLEKINAMTSHTPIPPAAPTAENRSPAPQHAAATDEPPAPDSPVDASSAAPAANSKTRRAPTRLAPDVPVAHTGEADDAVSAMASRRKENAMPPAQSEADTPEASPTPAPPPRAQPDPVPEDPEAAPDGILLHDDPDDVPVRERIDLVALESGLTTVDGAAPGSLDFYLQGQPAFTDHTRQGRIIMANPTASQNDSMILSALLVAKKHLVLRGHIELTGSPAFKQRAIALIAEYDLPLVLKNDVQRQMLAAARETVRSEPPLPDTPTPLGQEAARILVHPTPGAPAAAVREAAALPPAILPQTVSTPAPRNASHQEATAGITGTLMEHGAAPYNFQQNAQNSYYARLRTAQGERLVWGVTLRPALNDSGVNDGDTVTLTLQGKKTVNVAVQQKDADGHVLRDAQGNALTRMETRERNHWQVRPALDPTVVHADSRQMTPPGSLLVYPRQDYLALQATVSALAQQAGVSLPPLPALPDALWMTPNGKGIPAPAQPPDAPALPAPSAQAGEVLFEARDASAQLKLLLVKAQGDFVQGVVHHDGAYKPVLGRLCRNAEGQPYMLLNDITSNGLTPLGRGNPVNNADGSFNHYVFRLKDEPQRLYAAGVAPEKRDPALQQQLGFECAPVAPDQPVMRRESTASHRQTPGAPRPGR